MPGWSNSTNKFGPTPYVVGTVLGDGVNYTSIQSAINDAFAAGGGVVYIRPGAYTENLSLLHHVDLHGVAIDGRLPGVFAEVQVTGNHTFSPLAGTNICIIENISFDSAAGDTFTSAPAAGAFCILGMKYCGGFATGRFLFANPAATGYVQFVSLNSNFQATGICFDLTANFASVDFTDCEVSSSGAEAIALGDATCQCQIESTLVSASTSAITAQGCGVNISWSKLQSNDSCVSMPSGNVATLESFHNVYQSNAASGFYVDDNGQGSSYAYADDVATGSATSYQFSVSPKFWRPTATAVAAPGTSDPRGTACFDSTMFTVTDGFVQTNASGIFPWVDQAGLATVVANQGNFNTSAGANSLTLPVAPVQGDVCKFKCTNAQLLTINASGAQTIQMGAVTSIPGGNITSTLSGDAVDLTYFAAGNSWIANSIIGNWNII